jgi:hypothetical protein
VGPGGGGGVSTITAGGPMRTYTLACDSGGMKRTPKTISVSKPARTARDLARNLAIPIGELFIHDLFNVEGRENPAREA